MMKEKLRKDKVVDIEFERYAPEFPFFVQKQNDRIGLNLIRFDFKALRKELKIARIFGVAKEVNAVLVKNYERYDLCVEPFMRVVGVTSEFEFDIKI